MTMPTPSHVVAPRAVAARGRGSIRRGVAHLLALATLLVVAGCSLTARVTSRTHHYPLSFDPATVGARAVAAPDAPAAYLAFTVARRYRMDVYVFDETSREVAYEKSHLWTELPQGLVTDVFASHLRASGLFSAVMRQPSRALPTVTINAYLRTFDLIRREDGTGSARCVVEVEVVNRDESRLIWSGSVERIVEAEKNEIGSMVRAMNAAVNACAADLAALLAKGNVLANLRTGAPLGLDARRRGGDGAGAATHAP